MKGMYKLFLLILLAFSCSGEQGVNGDGNEPPTEIIPSNLVVNIEVDGADDNNPNGNGTGLVSLLLKLIMQLIIVLDLGQAM